MKLISISWGRARSQADLLLQNDGYSNLHHGLDVVTDTIVETINGELNETY